MCKMFALRKERCSHQTEESQRSTNSEISLSFSISACWISKKWSMLELHKMFYWAKATLFFISKKHPDVFFPTHLSACHCYKNKKTRNECWPWRRGFSFHYDPNPKLFSEVPFKLPTRISLLMVRTGIKPVASPPVQDSYFYSWLSVLESSVPEGPLWKSLTVWILVFMHGLMWFHTFEPPSSECAPPPC